MVECAKCHETGLKICNCVATMMDGKACFVCKKCAAKLLGNQKPKLYHEDHS